MNTKTITKPDEEIQAAKQEPSPAPAELGTMADKLWKRVVLECSLKPFTSTAPEALEARSYEVLHAWERLATRGEQVGVLLWVSDGSDLLQWSGDLDDPMTAAQYVGFCNLDKQVYASPYYAANKARYYLANPPHLCYRDLRAIIASLRAAALELYGMEISVAMTFDPGPEFAFSKFKYEWHPEILYRDFNNRTPMHFVSCQSTLCADPRAYGGFPGGIPEGTSLGTFMGKQVTHYAASMGFDYIWLSNGFGYTHHAWAQTGEILRDGAFMTEAAAREREATLRFWRDFRAECRLPVEVRGTNQPVGVDIGGNGVPHVDIMRVGKLRAQPCNVPVSNAPGMHKSLITYLSRIAALSDSPIPYRAYVNDPWFERNPWHDEFVREPFDFYMSTSVSRLNTHGGVDTPSSVHILSIDNERGEVREEQAAEIVPHLTLAARERADVAAPIVWVYPYGEYDEVLKQQPDLLSHVHFHDNYMLLSADGGMPAGSVCNSRTFVQLASEGKLPDSAFVAPVPLGDWAYGDALLQHVANGGRVLLYGSPAHAPARLLEALGIECAEEIGGDFEVRIDERLSRGTSPVVGNAPLRHRPLLSGGGLRAVAKGNDGVLVEAAQGSQRRAYAVVRSAPRWHGGTLAWIRGTVPADANGERGQLVQDGPGEVQPSTHWMRRLLSVLGIDISYEQAAPALEPVRMVLKRYQGAWYFAGAKPDTTVHARIRMPDGAPAFMDQDTAIVDGYAEEHFGKTIYNEVRFFVDMPDGTVEAQRLARPFGKRRSLRLSGLRNTTVTIYPEPEALTEGTLIVQPWANADRWDGEGGGETVPFTVDMQRQCAVVREYTGTIYVKW